LNIQLNRIAIPVVAMGMVACLGAASPRLWAADAVPSAAASVSAIDRLVAIEEIKKVKARYGRMIDGSDAEGLRKEVFAPDVVMDTEWPVDKSRKITRGRENVIKFIVWSLEYSKKDWTSNSNGHIATMPEIEVDSATTAHGLWRVGLGSFYRETYERIDEQWRIKTLRLERAPWYIPSDTEKASANGSLSLNPPTPDSSVTK
jgi:hypothetical protein